MKNKIDLTKLKTGSLLKRKSKVGIKNFARVSRKQETFADFINGLPDVLAAADLKKTIAAVKKAKQRNKKIVVMMGAHVIKCGLNPLLIDLMNKGYISALGFNGACLVHDFELAYCGQTSEDVDEAIRAGTFGMVKETAEFYFRALAYAAEQDLGLGEAFGKLMIKEKLKHADISLCANAARLGIPLTAHVAVGTDIVHLPADCPGDLLGRATLKDFRRFIEVVSELDQGVILNLGSAVIMPEIFIKALSAARNLGFKVRDFTSVCLDMIKHYRPMQNVVNRPTNTGGHGYYFIGHHEIMIPLLHRALLEDIK